MGWWQVQRIDDPPFGNLLVSPEDAVLDIYGVIPHAPQYQGLVQGAHHKHSVMVLCRQRVTHQSSVRRLTSVAADGLRPLQEAEVAGAGVRLHRVAARHKPGEKCRSRSWCWCRSRCRCRSSIPSGKVVAIGAVLPVYSVVASGIVWTLHPDLQGNSSKSAGRVWVVCCFKIMEELKLVISLVSSGNS